MKVLLKKDIRGVGRKGDIKDVADGFYRNFLMPQSLASVVTEQTVEQLQQEKTKMATGEEKRRDAVHAFLTTMKRRSITIKAKLDEKGHMFGSVNATVLEKELQKRKIDIAALRGKIILPEPIKIKGEHQVMVQFPSDVQGTLTVVIEKQ